MKTPESPQSSPATNYLPFYKGQGSYLNSSSSNNNSLSNDLGMFWQSLFGTNSFPNSSSGSSGSGGLLDWTNFLSNLKGPY